MISRAIGLGLNGLPGCTDFCGTEPVPSPNLEKVQSHFR